MKERRSYGEKYFRTEHTLDSFMEVGRVHPLTDFDESSLKADSQRAHLLFKDRPQWGATFPRTEDFRNIEGEIGYFHLHDNERVYANPIERENPGEGVVPCYDCKEMLVLDWNKSTTNE